MRILKNRPVRAVFLWLFDPNLHKKTLVETSAFFHTHIFKNTLTSYVDAIKAYDARLQKERLVSLSVSIHLGKAKNINVFNSLKVDY